MKALTKYKNVFKWISFGILVIVATTTLITLGWHGMTSALDASIETFKDNKITDKIYDLNGFLCIISIVSALFYAGGVYILKGDDTYSSSYSKKKYTPKKEFDIKATLKKIWPCILLVIFMGWTAVGCIQASMEAAAEAALRDEILENDTDRNKEIAAWTSGDRMKNAADRSWNGCENLKDGYWSFLFYAMVAVNVIIMGANSDKLKKNLLRILMMVSIILTLFAFFSIFDPTFLGGMVHYNRAIFNNSNHYGYFLCIATMLCAGLFMKEKNLYFKVMAFLGFALNSFMLIANNTFGAYLGVMIGVAIILLASLVEWIITYVKTQDSKEKTKELICAVALTGIFTFFSCTIIGVSSSFTATSKNMTTSKYITTTYGEYAETIKQNLTDATITKSSFEMSGDNRIYTINEKKLELVKSVEELDESKSYYKLGEYSYEIVSDKTTTSTKTPDEYSNITIVQNNFNVLFKDVKTILGYFKKEESKNTITSSGDNVEAITSGEVSGTKISGEENVNEKSGLSEDVSNTGSGRGEVWITSLKLINQRPVFGWGLENLLNEFYYQYGVNEGRTHNLILQLAGTTGIFGMLFYIVAVIAIFFKVLARYKNWGIIEYITVPTFIAYMISSLFGNSAFYTSPYFMIILGMMIATMLYKDKKVTIEEHEDNKNK